MRKPRNRGTPLKRSEFKKIIKESIREVLVDDGLLSSMIKEAMAPTILSSIQASALLSNQNDQYDREEEEEETMFEAERIKESVEKQQRKLMETRKIILDAIGQGSYKDDYNLEGIFENTSPLSSAGKVGESPSPSSPLGDINPKDPGVDISIFAKKKKVWQQMIK